MRPLIGITCSRLVGGSWGLYSRGHFMDYTFAEYSQAVLAAGGAPVLIPVAQNTESIANILGALGGLILSGGPDVNPRFYGEQPLDGLGEVDEGLDLMESRWHGRPSTGTSRPSPFARGIQVLNVSQKGTLYQDVASQISDAINHGQKRTRAFSPIWFALPRTPGSPRFGERGNLGEQQAPPSVKAPGPGLIVSARASDGVIEALEHPGKRFVLGVQWHPEGTWQHDLCSQKLFEALIQEAGR